MASVDAVHTTPPSGVEPTGSPPETIPPLARRVRLPPSDALDELLAHLA